MFEGSLLEDDDVVILDQVVGGGTTCLDGKVRERSPDWRGSWGDERGEMAIALIIERDGQYRASQGRGNEAKHGWTMHPG
jgi:hypothetical protein